MVEAEAEREPQHAEGRVDDGVVRLGVDAPRVPPEGAPLEDRKHHGEEGGGGARWALARVFGHTAE